MAGAFPDADMNAFLDAQIVGANLIRLWLVLPDNNGAGGTEVSAASYAPIVHAAWNGAAAKIKTNDGEINYGDPLEAWGTIVGATAETSPGGVFKGVSEPFVKVIDGSEDKVYIPDDGLIFSTGQ